MEITTLEFCEKLRKLLNNINDEKSFSNKEAEYRLLVSTLELMFKETEYNDGATITIEKKYIKLMNSLWSTTRIGKVLRKDRND